MKIQVCSWNNPWIHLILKNSLSKGCFPTKGSTKTTKVLAQRWVWFIQTSGGKKECSLFQMEQKWFRQGSGWAHYSWVYKAFLSEPSGEWSFTDGLKHPGAFQEKGHAGMSSQPRDKGKIIVPKNERVKRAPMVWSHSKLKSFSDKNQDRATSPPLAEEGGKRKDKPFVKWVKQSTTTGRNAAMEKKDSQKWGKPFRPWGKPRREQVKRSCTGWTHGQSWSRRTEHAGEHWDLLDENS